MYRTTFLTTALAALLATGAQAECMQGLTVKFTESAPRDRFEIIHTATGVFLTGLRIDLSSSAGGLVFDTAAGGNGVEVFQPFVPEGEMQHVDVADGAEQLEVQLNEMSTGQRAGFTIDVDDQRAQSDLGQIRVTGAEISGASVVFNLADGTVLNATFDQENRAKVCT
ncbi:aggregation factor core [uncultured Roseobacter sp.]|uniref:aggregation factor core n=1 Tax=uncultured Roseobacter sp. TaxID=114847 RepID=UPI002605CF9E|nr:aggregation factor core [uncultured Roseobacter sp.]